MMFAGSFEIQHLLQEKENVLSQFSFQHSQSCPSKTYYIVSFLVLAVLSFSVVIFFHVSMGQNKVAGLAALARC